MMSKTTSPTPFQTVEEQLRSLYQRRSVVDRLIHTLETYQRITPVPYLKKPRVA